MKQIKVKSFTLSELLIVMIITAIVVGIAFSVLNLVQKQIRFIEKNFQKTTSLSLSEQQLWQDFNTHSSIIYTENKIILQSDIDTTFYLFRTDYLIRNLDTINVKLIPVKLYYEGSEVKSGYIDAVLMSGNAELPDYSIFVSSRKDAAHYMNKDGF